MDAFIALAVVTLALWVGVATVALPLLVVILAFNWLFRIYQQMCCAQSHCPGEQDGPDVLPTPDVAESSRQSG